MVKLKEKVGYTGVAKLADCEGRKGIKQRGREKGRVRW